MSNYIQKSYQKKYGNKDNTMETNIIEDVTYLVEKANNNSTSYKVYTALLTQSGGDDADTLSGGQGSVLDFGQTYFIASNPDNYDLTIYGAPNSNVGTYFVCNDPTSPVLIYTKSLQLEVNYGAPVVTVLENTIGNIWFTYNSVGDYSVNLSNSIDTGKTFLYIGNGATTNQLIYFEEAGINTITFPGFYGSSSTIYIYSTTDGYGGGKTDNRLKNTPIEIRVYN